MTIGRIIVAAGLALAAASGAGEALAQTPRPAPRGAKSNTAPPPKWDRAVRDVFFTDARQRLGPGPAPGAAAAAEKPADQATTPANPLAATGEAPAGAASAGRWSALIAASALEDEIKSLAKPIAAAVQTPTGFKGGGYKSARDEFTLLAVLYGVIAQYDGPVRWQKEAAGLRQLFGRAGMNCKVGTDSTFNEARLRSQDLSELIRGGAVTAPAAEADVRWPEAANRPPLMKRMERAQRERLAPWTATPTEFRKRREELIREAQLLAVLAEVIKHEGYEYADDATYRDYVDQLQAQCLELIEAAKNDDHAKAQSAASRLNQTCDACHGDFRS